MSETKSKRTENSAQNSVKRRGNPDKTIPFRFRPGQSGNPGGRPKKLLLDEVLEELLLLADSSDAIAIAKALIKKAKKGDSKAAQLIAERTQGKAKQSIKLDASIQIAPEERATKIAELISRRVGG